MVTKSLTGLLYSQENLKNYDKEKHNEVVKSPKTAREARLLRQYNDIIERKEQDHGSHAYPLAVLAIVSTSVSLETLYMSDTGGRSRTLQDTADVVREIQLIIQ